MLAALLFVSLLQSPEPIVRDSYGVPHIKAATWDDAFYHAGYAVAEDRLWQMENSRRLARGRMAEVFGPDFVASDRDVLRTFYTDEELQQQFDALDAPAKAAFVAYAKGINAFIKAGKLPTGYAQNGFQPEPWTELDSVAISIRLFQQFGKGGAGEIRNMALFGYLQNQPGAKGKELDILDDFAWQNDPSSPTTISASEDPQHDNPFSFLSPTRSDTEKHLAMLPKVGLLELLPGIRLALNEDSRLVAEKVNVPYKVGSYAIVVSPGRSTIGQPLLLSAPQMGFRTPSIVHEMSIQAPGLDVVGMDVPGMPGVLIGHTKSAAWGMTSGVADTDDIFYFPTEGADSYKFGDTVERIQVIARTLKVKGGEPVTVEQKRTRFGPIVIASNNSKVLFSRRSSYWMKEMQSYGALSSIYAAKTADEIEKGVAGATMSFNFFYATTSGDIGYRYLGLMPIRAKGLDPRFPTPGRPEFDWKGNIDPAQMPHVRNPKSGLLTNWNNKPVSWWPNYDTPAWGSVFRNQVLNAALEKPRLSPQDLEMAAWTIARRDPTFAALGTYAKAAVAASPDAMGGTYLEGFDGQMLEGSIGASMYTAFFDTLREELFTPVTGAFMTPDNFRLIVQPSVTLQALTKKTKVDYLNGRTQDEVLKSALSKAVARLTSARGPLVSDWRFRAPSIAVPGQPPIPYSDRGTYIQVVEVGAVPLGRNVVTPGVAESGAHSLDQVPLARAWLFKAMGWHSAS